LAKVIERCFEATGHTSIICDFSPPRTGDAEQLQIPEISADFISVAYNPGRAVRVSAPMLAAAIKQRGGREVIFTLATRDMNQLALQSQLLGAQLLGLENVIVVQGDDFTPRDLALVKPAGDMRSSELVASIFGMNQGVDFRDSRLRSPTDFCVGATVDLGRDRHEEAVLAHRKVRAGADFFISQPIFDPEDANRFGEAYAEAAGEPLTVPVYFGLQVLEQDGVIFSSVPESVRDELAGGRPGTEIALELFQRFREAGLNNIYLVPPIRRGGARGYGAAQEVLSAVERI
jgi:homocysteine S-methyltransferase